MVICCIFTIGTGCVLYIVKSCQNCEQLCQFPVRIVSPFLFLYNRIESDYHPTRGAFMTNLILICDDSPVVHETLGAY